MWEDYVIFNGNIELVIGVFIMEFRREVWTSDVCLGVVSVEAGFK